MRKFLLAALALALTSGAAFGAYRTPSVQPITCAAHQWINVISVGLVPTCAQPAAADISGLATSATTDTTNAANISSGTLPAARLPVPTAGTLGGVESLAATAHNFLTSLSTSGVFTQAQPAAADLSNGTTGSGGGVVLATAPTIAGLKWTGDTTSATSGPAGTVGEVVIGSATAAGIVNNTATNAVSVSLTAGHWECFNAAYTHPAGSTVTALMLVSVNTNATATLPTSFPTTGSTVSAFAGVSTGFVSGPQMYNFTSTTTVFGVDYVTYSVSTMTIDTQLTCKRIW